MANSLVTADKCLPVIDRVFREMSKTSILDASHVLSFAGVRTVKVLKIDSTGLGDYDRVNGYPKGDVSASWEEITPEIERGAQLSMDRIDNEEALNVMWGEVVGRFMREKVVPEVDSYRFAKYASWPGIFSGTGTFDLSNGPELLTAIDEAMCDMDDEEVPREGRVLFMNTRLMPTLNSSVVRSWQSEGGIQRELSSYNGMPIHYVPSGRFNTQITLNPGSGSWGFTPGGNQINFLIVYKGSVMQITKHDLPKIFHANDDVDSDRHKFDYRLLHDVDVFDNKVKGLYVNVKA